MILKHIQNGEKKQNKTPFLQPFTYTEINLNIIYTATDYSMYKARSKLKLTGALYFGREKKTTKNWRLVDVKNSQESTGWFGKDTQIWTVPGSCPLTKIGPLQNTVADTSIQLQQLFVCLLFSTNPKCFFLRELLNSTRRRVQTFRGFSETPNSVSYSLQCWLQYIQTI